MSKERVEKIRFWYGIFLTLFTVIVGILFIVQVWSIYRSAPQSPYTVENISKHFKQIALPVWLWVAAVVIDRCGALVLTFLMEEEQKRIPAQVDLRLALSRVKKRLPTEGSFLPKIDAIERKEENYRIIVSLVSGILVTALAVFALLIMVDGVYLPIVKADFFTSHNGVVNRISQTAILALLALGILSVALILKENSRKREQKAYLALIVEAKKSEEISVKSGATIEKKCCLRKVKGWVEASSARIEKLSPEAKKKWTLGIRIGLCAVGVLFIGIGIYNGGMKDVLLKAINICTQCIGLG